MTTAKKGLSRRTMALLWMLLVAVVIGVLIAYEQISILYLLTTVALVTLLLIVGFADLERVGKPEGDDA
jgi:membrane protein implicated in regulation of membrane protease activity